jgi:Tfp pilus assembly protein PilF
MYRRRGSIAALLLVLVGLQPGCVLLSGTETNREAGTLPPKETIRVSLAVAEAEVHAGHFPEAILQYLRARQLDPKADVSSQLARLYASVGESALAREEYRKALEAHPGDADLWNDFGYYHYSMGKWQEAEKAYREAVKLSPNYARAWINLGLTLGQQQKYTESLAAFERAVPAPEARCNLGFVYATQGKLDLAREAYRSALKLDPRLPLAQAALAKLDRPVHQAIATMTATTAAKPVNDSGYSYMEGLETHPKEE